MFLTLWCVGVVLASLLAAGLPLCWLLNGRRPLTAEDYRGAPFLGMTALLLVLQNLVYFDVPVQWSGPVLWLALAAVWVGFWWGGHARAALTRPPAVVLAAGLVYLLQGAGLFWTGVSSYVGRSWTDQYNYTALAEFLPHVPFHTGLSDLDGRPYLVPAIFIKNERIGQSVLHAFFAASTFQDTRSLFEPTILLAPALLVLAVHAVCRRLGIGGRLALAAALTVGLLPSVTLLHLESFLSHSLAIPFLLFCPVVLADLAERPGGSRLIRAALFVTATGSIYAEIWPVLAALVVLVFGCAMVRHPRRGALLLSAIAVLASPVLLNVGMGRTLREVVGRLALPLLGDVYPWAFTVEGWSRLWLGDLAARATGFALSAVRLGTLGVTALAYFALIQRALGSWLGDSPSPPVGDGARTGFRLSLLALALLPLFIVGRGTQHPYQFYKLLLTISPLLVVGWALICQSLSASVVAIGLGRIAAWCGMGLVLAPAAAGTAVMVRDSVRLSPAPRTLAPLLRASVLREAAERLGALQNQQLVIAPQEALTQGWYNAWFAYFGRHNHVRVLNPIINDIEPYRVPQARGALSAADIPSQVHLLTSRPTAFRAEPAPDAALTWSNAGYELWQTSGPRWAFPIRFINPNGAELAEGHPFFRLGAEPAQLDILAGSAGILKCRANVRAGPPPARTGTRRLYLCTSAGHKSVVAVGEDEASWTIPVAAGRTTIFLSCVDLPILPPRSGTDPPENVWLEVQDLTLAFAPHSPAGGPVPRE